MASLVGRHIGKYHIIEQLGEGGMAVVYKAYDTSLERYVAIKFIRKEAVGSQYQAKLIQRFEREAKVLARLNHPNIVVVMEFGQFEEAPYMVMDFISSGSLKPDPKNPMSYIKAARLLAPIARALDYAHQRGIIHRDIKPSNILISETGDPKLCDFGIAKILDIEEDQKLTGTGLAIGTPDFMAPEQWQAKPVAQSDIYGLGMVFYELVTGKRPYAADTPAAVMLKQASEPLPRPSQFVPGLPEEVEQVIFKALAPKVENRYATMGEFAAALEQLGQGQALWALSPSRVTIPSPAGIQAGKTPPAPVTSQAGVAPTSQRSIPTAFRDPMEPQRVPPPDQVTLPPLNRVESLASAASLHPSLGGKGWLLAAGGLGALALLVGVLGGAWLLFNLLKPATHTLAPTSTPLPRASFTFTPGITSTLTPGVVKGIGSTQVSPTDGMVMVYVPEGDFRMGSDKSVDSNALGDEMPQHKVYLDAFWIDRTEVTNAQYTRCVSDKKCTAPHETKSDSRSSYYRKNTYSDYPVIYVDWTQANAYCAWAGRRLPTEAEWEKAARGPDGRIYPWGNQADNSKANYKSNDTTQVGSYPSGASPYEAWDMAGNVWEWVADWYSATYYQDPPPDNPKGPDSGSGRVRRGGGWFNFEEGVRTAYRIGSDPMDRDGSIGFRCAASPAP